MEKENSEKTPLEILTQFVVDSPKAARIYSNYAYFVNQVEPFYYSFASEFPDEIGNEICPLIGDLEILNALFLADWEDFGLSKNPSNLWSKYQYEADDLVNQLRNILIGEQKKYIPRYETN